MRGGHVRYTRDQSEHALDGVLAAAARHPIHGQRQMFDHSLFLPRMADRRVLGGLPAYLFFFALAALAFVWLLVLRRLRRKGVRTV